MAEYGYEYTTGDLVMPVDSVAFHTVKRRAIIEGVRCFSPLMIVTSQPELLDGQVTVEVLHVFSDEETRFRLPASQLAKPERPDDPEGPLALWQGRLQVGLKARLL